MSSSDDDSGSDSKPLPERAVAPFNEDRWRNDDPNMMRLLISTHNHLGYEEDDAVRGNDSFAAFEEVLYLAKKFNCDIVLLAGNLFDKTRPTKSTLTKTMDILRRYCMGPEPVRVEFLSDAATQLQSALTVNYQDDYYSVGLPLFTIHGSRDDPSRDYDGGDLVSAQDLLAKANLINYFGRQDNADKIEISPLLLQKGSTKIALYGLGYLPDERLKRLYEQSKIRFLRVTGDDGKADDSFFNIFTLHQNWVLGRGDDYVEVEDMIPEWMDVVVWVSFSE